MAAMRAAPGVRRLVVAVAVSIAMAACIDEVPPDASGEQVYAKVCARCHGADLGGGIGPALGAGSRAAARPDSYYQVAITRGIGRMPSFRSTLDEEQVARVIEYIRARQASSQ